LQTFSNGKLQGEVKKELINLARRFNHVLSKGYVVVCIVKKTVISQGAHFIEKSKVKNHNKIGKKIDIY
jgi:hypothetical protein